MYLFYLCLDASAFVAAASKAVQDVDSHIHIGCGNSDSVTMTSQRPSLQNYIVVSSHRRRSEKTDDKDQWKTSSRSL